MDTSIKPILCPRKSGPTHNNIFWNGYATWSLNSANSTRQKLKYRRAPMRWRRWNYSIHYHVWEPSDVWAFLGYGIEHMKLPVTIEYFGELPDEILFILKKH